MSTIHKFFNSTINDIGWDPSRECTKHKYDCMCNHRTLYLSRSLCLKSHFISAMVQVLTPEKVAQKNNGEDLQ
jgi:hypothetical protein